MMTITCTLIDELWALWYVAKQACTYLYSYWRSIVFLTSCRSGLMFGSCWIPWLLWSTSASTCQVLWSVVTVIMGLQTAGSIEEYPKCCTLHGIENCWSDEEHLNWSLEINVLSRTIMLSILDYKLHYVWSKSKLPIFGVLQYQNILEIEDILQSILSTVL